MHLLLFGLLATSHFTFLLWHEMHAFVDLDLFRWMKELCLETSMESLLFIRLSMVLMTDEEFVLSGEVLLSVLVVVSVVGLVLRLL